MTDSGLIVIGTDAHGRQVAVDAARIAASARYLQSRTAELNWYTLGSSPYAPGGVVQAVSQGPGKSSVMARQSAVPDLPSLNKLPGISFREGFSQQDDLPPAAAGHVTGYRWWTLTLPDLRRNPASADDDWWDPDFRERLRGQRAPWEPGVNTATCLRGPEHDPAVVPDRHCNCGFWAYWQLQSHSLGDAPDQIPVCGVIKGWGKTRRGPYGFRCATARILAVTLPFPIVPAIGDDCQDGWRPALMDVAGGQVMVVRNGRKPAALNLDTPAIRAAITHAEAWTAVIGDRIGQLYPGVRVLESVRALQALYPPDPTITGSWLAADEPRS